MTRQQELTVQALDSLKKPPFNLTGIKVELEAFFNRRNCRAKCSKNLPECNNGQIACLPCEGRGRMACKTCGYRRFTVCEDCQGRGWRYRKGTTAMVSHRACKGIGTVDCTECGDKDMTCPECKGRKQTACAGSHINLSTDRDCQQLISDRCAAAGIKEWMDENVVFSRVYTDPSVDTEWTVTLKADDVVGVVEALPIMVEAFADLGKAIDMEFDVRGAGLHIAFLNSYGAVYPTDDSVGEDVWQHFDNFKRSMPLLMPALFFLSSHNKRSRPIKFRRPEVVDGDSHEEKWGAIRYYGGALEFRTFETCYDKPMAILDNLLVMSKCVKRYWKPSFVRTGLARKYNGVGFGCEGSRLLSRLYPNKKTEDLMMAGLKLIKPDYRTLDGLLAERQYRPGHYKLTEREDSALRSYLSVWGLSARFDYTGSYITTLVE